MPIVRPLFSDQDFQEAVDQQYEVRVFKEDQLVHAGTTVIRFTDQTVVTQSDVSNVDYYSRTECQFYELRN
ncbi:hypothetical protein [Paenibacillus lemnae]|uniref:Uncharacterized protein n=1 Tax=Paenibacillus lemnae TaxID=1330551 RepID=A0A848MAT9_PAELE|nr:hypothetical protein [Paenibacillus lemnae]NMO98207.1 hypothetical protein [Paenibacillus lemnae]